MSRKKLSVLYVALNISIIFVIGFLDPNIKGVSIIFHGMKYYWLGCAVFFMLLFWGLDAGIIYYYIQLKYKHIKFLSCLKISIIGQYYNAITPFSSGGQPSQLYYMKRLKIPVGIGSSVLMMKFLVYQTVISIYGIVAFAYKYKFLRENSILLFWIVLIGVSINLGSILLTYSISGNKRFNINFILRIYDFLSRIRLIKKTDKLKEKITKNIEEFHISITYMKGDTKAVLLIFLITFLQLIVLFSITYFIYRSFCFHKQGWLEITFVQAFLYMAVCYFPTPGSTGASEGGFYMFFRFYFDSNYIFIAMLLWRLITFYMNVFAGVCIVFTDTFSNWKKSK